MISWASPYTRRAIGSVSLINALASAKLLSSMSEFTRLEAAESADGLSGPSMCRFAFRDRGRDGLLVFFVCIILLRVAAAVYFLTHLLVAAAPVVVLARRVTIANFTAHASRRVVGQWGGAGGACCEDHFALAGCLWASRASRVCECANQVSSRSTGLTYVATEHKHLLATLQSCAYIRQDRTTEREDLS